MLSRRTSPQWCYWTGEHSLVSSNHEAYSRKFHLAFIRPENVVSAGPRVLQPSETQPIYVRYGGHWSIFLDLFELPNYLVSQIQDDFQRYLCHAFGLNKENSFFHTGTNEKRDGFSSVWQKLRLVESCSDFWPSPICTQNLWSSATVTTGLLPRPFSSDCSEKSTALGHLAQGSRALLEAGWGLVYWRLGPSALSLSATVHQHK